jgi:hypothetical protein
MYVEPKRGISSKRLLVGAVVQGVLLVTFGPRFTGGVQVLACGGAALVVLVATVPRPNVIFGAIIVATSFLVYYAAFHLGGSLLQELSVTSAIAVSSFAAATVLAFVMHGLLFERADLPMTLLVGISPLASAPLFGTVSTSRTGWSLYHAVWCWLFLAGFYVACRKRGLLTRALPADENAP